MLPHSFRKKKSLISFRINTGRERDIPENLSTLGRQKYKTQIM